MRVKRLWRLALLSVGFGGCGYPTYQTPEKTNANGSDNSNTGTTVIKQYTCDEFANLPPPKVETTEKVLAVTVETIGLWNPWLHCSNRWLNPIDPPPDNCSELWLGSGGLGHEDYYIAVRFVVPETEKTHRVFLELCPLEIWGNFSYPDFDIELLQNDWWHNCQDNRQPVCDDFPETEKTPGTTVWEWIEDKHGWAWLRFDITSNLGNLPNNLLLKYTGAGLVEGVVFAGHSYLELAPQPRLVTMSEPEPPSLCCPLPGTFTEQIITYPFGAGPWQNEHCGGPNSPPLRHTGVDLQTKAGTPVFAVRGGTVTYSTVDEKWGGYVVVEHCSDNNECWTSTYTHVIPYAGITTGIIVKRSQQIAEVAPLAGGPHLHFQARHGRFDPVWSLRGRLPDKACFVVKTKKDEPEFPERFVDPECLGWE